MIVGCFDPVHEGHFDHIRKAGALGDFLYVACHKDNAVIQKKTYCSQTYEVRKAVLQGLLLLWGITGRVLSPVEDSIFDRHYKDGIDLTIETLRPHIFAKGGDRIPGNLPKSEIEVCKKVGCRIVYGVGDLLNSSSKMMERARANENTVHVTD